MSEHGKVYSMKWIFSFADSWEERSPAFFTNLEEIIASAATPLDDLADYVDEAPGNLVPSSVGGVFAEDAYAFSIAELLTGNATVAHKSFSRPAKIVALDFTSSMTTSKIVPPAMRT
ncbi:hypothetical protein DXG01_016202, partial [Tephrocybe rancida]